MKVHISEKIDKSLLGDCSILEFTFGDLIPPDTEILVQGAVKAEETTPLTNLKAVIIPWAGLPGPTRKTFLNNPNVAVFNIHHNASMTAETAIALMMAVSRNIVPLDRRMRMRDWGERSKGIKKTFKLGEFIRTQFLNDRREWTAPKESPGTVGLAGKTVVILGFGEIGQRVANICDGLGMNVIGIRRGTDRIVDRFEVWSISRLEEALSLAHVLHICLPLTTETKGLLTKERISLLPDNSIIVNVGRGAIIDEAALFNELKSKRLHGAGLDVWWRYPGENDSCDCAPGSFDWAGIENVVMTPHIGGSGAGVDELRWRAVGNLIRQIQAGDLKTNRVDLELGY